MIEHIDIVLRPRSRGYYIITDEILAGLPSLPQIGQLTVFIKHTSAGLTINENADPTVLEDYENFFNHIVPERMPWVKHDMEGDDDMPAHIKASLVGSSVTIPICDGRLDLGIWQGIYLCEFRDRVHQREIVVTIIS